MLGTLLNPEDDSVYRLLVRTEWLRTEHPEFLKLVTKAENRTTTDSQSLQQLLAAHIRELEQTVPQELERIGFLKERLAKLKSTQDGGTAPEAVILEIAGGLVRRQLLQKPQVRRVGELAVLNRLADVETRSVTDLKSKITEMAAAGTELITELPSDSKDSAQQQFSRILINAEYLFGNRCRLIRHGGQYFDADQQNADLSRILPGLLQGELQNQLQQLLSEPGFTGAKPANVPAQNAASGPILDAAAAALASGQNARLVEVSQMQVDPQQATARVQISLYFKTTGAATWTQVHQLTTAASAADVAADQGQQIANDPGVRQVTQLFQTLGVSGGQLATAMSVGAIVQSAQNSAQQQLTAWISNSNAAPALGLRIARMPITQLP
jgi:hypothetical protein